MKINWGEKIVMAQIKRFTERIISEPFRYYYHISSRQSQAKMSYNLRSGVGLAVVACLSVACGFERSLNYDETSERSLTCNYPVSKNHL